MTVTTTDRVRERLDEVGRARGGRTRVEAEVRAATAEVVEAALSERVTVTEIARRLGVSRPTVYEVIRALGIDPGAPVNVTEPRRRLAAVRKARARLRAAEEAGRRAEAGLRAAMADARAVGASPVDIAEAADMGERTVRTWLAREDEGQ